MSLVFISSANKVIRRVDFKPGEKDKLPNISDLLDGLSRRNYLEAENQLEGDAEEDILLYMTALHYESTIAFMAEKGKA